MSVPDQYMTVVFRELPVDQRRAIINQKEAVRLSHGDQLAVRDRLDKIAEAAADMNNRNAERISALESALREIIARWDADCGSRMAAELPDAIEAARELIAEEMEIPQMSELDTAQLQAPIKAASWRIDKKHMPDCEGSDKPTSLVIIRESA
jgi:hypothetical protein